MRTPHINTASDHTVRVHDDLSRIDGAAWNALLSQQPHPTPFLRIEYLQALHDSGSATPDTGWAPLILTVERQGALVGACVAYVKSHSYGEYVFDWAWADAYRRHGLRYFPKMVLAVPFTPVPGTRLLAADDETRLLLANSLRSVARESRMSSAHALFLDEADRAAFDASGWMLREGVQFHWEAPADGPPADFTAFLATLQREKRKKIQQERRRVADAGVQFTVHEAHAIDDRLWDFFHHCYTLTYAAHHSTPYLTREFFRQVAATMPEHWLMFVARIDGEPVGASLIVIDRAHRTAWGRYWGAVRHLPCLHFEACYYQPLAWCMAQGFARFEGGAQGEHKMARGLMPVKTASAHWLRDERFADAVRDFLAQETQGIAAYVNELEDRNPFKPSPVAPSSS